MTAASASASPLANAVTVHVVWMPETTLGSWTTDFAPFLDAAAVAVLSTKIGGGDPFAAATATFSRGRELSANATDPPAPVSGDLGVAVTTGPPTAPQEGETVILISAVPTAQRRADGVRLGAIAIRGPGFRPGLLQSPTTRRAGVVSLTDVAPTILTILGKPIPAEVTGRAMRSVTATGAPARALALEREIIRAHDLRYPLTRGILLLGALAALCATIAVATGAPRRARDAIHVFGLTALALPLTSFAAGVLPGGSATPFVLAVLLAAGARAAFGRGWSIVAIVGLSAVLPLVDLAIGEPLSYRSPLAYQIAGGGRFYGVDEGVLGMVVGALLVAGAMTADRTRSRVALAGVFAAAVWLLGAPAFGSKFGAALTAVPALGVLALRLGGHRFTLRAAMIIAAATVAIAGAFVVVDRVGDSASRSHVARATAAGTGYADLIARKLEATARITFTTVWGPALVLFVACLGWLFVRHRLLVDRGFWGRPHLRAAIVASLVGAAAALVVQDGGVVASAMIMLYASVTATMTLVAPEDV